MPFCSGWRYTTAALCCRSIAVGWMTPICRALAIKAVCSRSYLHCWSSVRSYGFWGCLMMKRTPLRKRLTRGSSPSMSGQGSAATSRNDVSVHLNSMHSRMTSLSTILQSTMKKKNMKELLPGCQRKSSFRNIEWSEKVSKNLCRSSRMILFSKEKQTEVQSKHRWSSSWWSSWNILGLVVQIPHYETSFELAVVPPKFTNVGA